MRQSPYTSNNPKNLAVTCQNIESDESNLFLKLFDSLRSSVFLIDQNGQIILANNMAKSLFNNQNLFRKNLTEFVSIWDDPERCVEEVFKVAESGTSILNKIEYVSINGKRYCFQTDKIPIKNEVDGTNEVLMTLDDISELKAKEYFIEQNESRYKAFISNSQDAIWRLDIVPPIPVDWPNEKIVEEIIERSILAYNNQVFSILFGFDRSDELLGFHFKKLFLIDRDKNIVKKFEADIRRLVKNKFKFKTMDVTFKTKKETNISLQTTFNGIVKDELLTEIWCISRDNTERQHYIDQLEYQNTHDILTGLPNRTLLEKIAKSIMLVKRSASKVEGDLALMILDLDRFKEINDTLGHHVGDNIIKEIGPRLNAILLPFKGVVARLGGDEFAVLLPNIKSQKQLLSCADAIKSSIRKEFFVNNMVIEVRASIGISLFPSQAHDFSTLLRYADVAMYISKKTLSSIQLYDPAQDQHTPKRLVLMNELGKAIRENQLTLFYQPKIALGSSKVVGVEALSRWFHPTMGFVSPAEFIPIAEMTDMINEMTFWVLSESLKQLRLWRDQDLIVKVAVNISARNLLSEDLLNEIKRLLNYYDLPASCLELEITESTIMNNAEYSLSILEKISSLGIDLSIDDFGTGYSSLSYLKRLPVQWLKIDYAFIINMLEDDQDQIIVNSTIQMAHNLGLQVVAEGVETQDLLEKLQSMSCEYAQGYHIARPMPADEFQAWYINHVDNH